MAWITSRAAVVSPYCVPKVAATKGYGAQVHLVGHVLEDALTEAIAFAERTGAVFIHPFDHPDVVAGQGTVGLEILEQLPQVGTILVGTGGGGLVSGIAAAVKADRPEVQVVGVQAAQAAAWPDSLAAGHPVRLSSTNTMADGIAVAEPGAVTFAHVAKLVDDQELEHLDLALQLLQGALVLGLHQLMNQAGGRNEADGMALLAGRQAQRQGDVALPVPLLPRAITLSWRRMYSPRASSSTSILLSEGIALKSKLSRDFTAGNLAWRTRRSIMRRSRSISSSSARRKR